MDVLAGEAFIESEGSSKMTSIEPYLIDGINFLLERSVHSTTDQDKPLSRMKLSRLLHLCSRHLQHILKESPKTNQALNDSEIIIKHALGFCEQLVSLTNSTAYTPFSMREFYAVWTFYISIADEVSTRALISLALGVYKETGWAPFSHQDGKYVESLNEPTFSLTTISSHEALDEQIHHIRSSSLAPVSLLFSLGPQTMLAPDRKSSLLNSLTQSLIKLCTDMCDGFQGQSGGMRKSLFSQYITSIDGCINSIAIIIDSMSSITLCESIQKFVAVNESIVAVWNAFCEHSLEESFLVKAMLQLCVDKLPSLLRKVEMITEQCIDPNTNLMPNVSLLGHANASLCSAMGRSDSPSNNLDKSRQEVYPITQLLEPEFASTNVAKWACNIALANMSSVWNESNKVIAAAHSNSSSSITSQTGPTRIAYAKRRIDCFQSLHTSISKIFETTERQQSSTSKGEDEESGASPLNTTVAINMSYQGKSYLCSCLDKMTISILLSIKALTSYLNKPSRRQSKNLMESIASSVGYFSSIVSQSGNEYDAITAPRIWFASECNAENDTVVNHSVLHRLQKIINRTESIEIELQNLRMIVFGFKEENTLQMNVLNEVAFANRPGATTETAFCELVDMSVKTVQSRLKSLRSADSDAGLFLDDDDDGSGNEGQMHASKKRRLGFAPSRSRRMSLRSRNETIDDWLSLDNEELASGERFNADDAFVDLEDFIVEG
jgi:hypothetical protein